MTFILGMRCIDGLVLCADALEEDGIVKKRVNKIFRIEDDADWGIAIAGAGDGGIIDKFNVEAQVRLPKMILDRYGIENYIEELLSEFRMKYRQGRFSLIVAFYNKSTSDCFLYRSEDMILAPVEGSVQIGCGNELWSLLADSIYDRKHTVLDNIAVGSFATRLAAHYAVGVGEPIQIISYTKESDGWSSLGGWDLDTFLVRHVTAGNINAAIREWWRTFNAPGRVAQTDEMRRAFNARHPSW